MSEGILWGLAAGACLGGVLGVLATLWLRAKRETAIRIEFAVLRARLKSDEIMSAERDQALDSARAQLQGMFGQLARESLESNNEGFLQLARERLTRQQHDASSALRERETAIASMVQPIRDALNKTETQIQSIERERIDAFATLKSQMEIMASGQIALSRETRNLVTALRKPQVRGQWGEITLKRLVELAGMTAHVDFTEQQQQTTESGTVRPDMIVHMPEQRDIVIDVKTPLEAYLAAVEAPDDEERGAQMLRHAQIVGARIKELASKRYWSQFENSPDFVVLFLPGDQFLFGALQENPALVDESLRQNVMLATPTSLVALLKAVAYGWKQTALADNAAEIRRLGEDVYKRLAIFSEHLARLGKALGQSVESFNRAVGSLEQQVLPAARRFPDLGLRVDREIAVLDPLGVTRSLRTAAVAHPAVTATAAPSPGEGTQAETT